MLHPNSTYALPILLCCNHNQSFFLCLATTDAFLQSANIGFIDLYDA